MKSIVVTGGASCGKSTFCKVIEKNFAKVYYFSADLLIEELYKEDKVKKKFIRL